MKHNFAVTLWLVLLFLAANIIGLKVVDSYIDHPATVATGNFTWKDIPSVGPVRIDRPKVEKTSNVGWIVGGILAGTLIALWLIKHQKLNLWRLWFFLAIAITLYVAFAAFLDAKIAVSLAVVVAFWRLLRPNVIIHNLSELFVYGGLAAIFVPMLSIAAAFIMLAALSAYDMYAVWKSRHMVRMAKFQAQNATFAGLLLPYKGASIKRGLGSKGKGRTAILGGGDVGFPLIFAGVVMKKAGFSATLAVPAVTAVALLLLLIYSKKGRFYPAMPFLSIGCIVGYFVTLLLA